MGDFADDRRDQELRAELDRFARIRAAKGEQQVGRLKDHVTRGQQDTGKGDTPQVVRVRIAGAPKAYGYLWRGAEPLEMGEWVMLPGNVVSPEGCKGRVEGFGRDGYNGELKEVVSRIEKPDPWLARMEAVTTRQEASRVYRKAEAAGLDPQRLVVLERAGKAALKRRAQAARTSGAEGSR
jgi:hypothetical protein